jgi:hypothetical protein
VLALAAGAPHKPDMTTLALALASLALGLPGTNVNDPLPADPPRELIEAGIAKVRAAIAQAAATTTDLATRRELRLEAVLASRAQDAALRTNDPTLAQWVYGLDLQGEAADPVERLLLLERCARAARVPIDKYVLCVHDWRALDDAAVFAALDRRALDPVLAHVARAWATKALGRVRELFGAVEQQIAKDPHLQALRDAALTAPARWSDESVVRRAAFDAARPVEESWLLDLAPARFVGCDAPAVDRLEALLGERASQVVRTARSELAADPAAAALVRAIGLCARARGDLATTYAASDLLGATPVLWGPRLLGHALALAVDAAAGRRDMSARGDHPILRADEVVRQGDDDRRITVARGRVAKLEPGPVGTKLTFKSETLPALEYRCSGSGAITGVYRTSDGFGVSRDMSCQYVQVGTRVVPGAIVTLPSPQAAHLRRGDFALVYAGREGDAPARLVWAAAGDDETGLRVVLGWPVGGAR